MKRLFALLLSAALLCALAPIAGAGTPAHTIQVCGTELTAANGYTYTDANGGTAQYDPAAATLTLTNLNVSATAGPALSITGNAALTLQLVGSSTLTAPSRDTALYAAVDLTITGQVDDSLRLSAGEYGIRVLGDVTMKNCTVQITSDNEALRVEFGDLRMENVTADFSSSAANCVSVNQGYAYLDGNISAQAGASGVAFHVYCRASGDEKHMITLGEGCTEENGHIIMTTGHSSHPGLLVKARGDTLVSGFYPAGTADGTVYDPNRLFVGHVKIVKTAAAVPNIPTAYGPDDFIYIIDMGKEKPAVTPSPTAAPQMPEVGTIVPPTGMNVNLALAAALLTASALLTGKKRR